MKPQNPTTPENLDKINKMYVSLEKLIINLYTRWETEKEHEDLKEYGEVIQKHLPENFIITRMNKRPFGFNFTIGTSAEYSIICKRTEYQWKRIK